MRWPWTPKPELETRSASYSDELVTLLAARAAGVPVSQPNATAAVESCAGIVGRAFASAEIEGPTWAQSALTPAVMAMIGRALIRSGEILFAIDATRDGMVKLYPSADHDIDGGHDPDSWLYRLNLQGPSQVYTREQVSAEGVLHFAYSHHPQEPWRGIGPIQAASLSGRLSAETTKALGDELSGPRGSLLPVPKLDGKAATLEGLRADIRGLSGALATVESMASSWSEGDKRTAPSREWESRRLGASPPDSVIHLQDLASKEIMSACGISPALFSSTAAASAREAYRQFLFSVISPLGKIVSAELSKKLETQVILTWGELRAADIMARARSYGSLITAQMDPVRAAQLTGLDT